jgi:hypothetical protein
MNRFPIVSLAVLALLAARPQEGEKDRLRRALGDNDLVGTWVYDDLEAGCSEAKKSGKPMLVVFR